MGTLEQSTKCVDIKDIRTVAFDVALVSLQLTQNTYGTLLWCFYCRLRGGKFRLERVKLRFIFLGMILTCQFGIGDGNAGTGCAYVPCT